MKTSNDPVILVEYSNEWSLRFKKESQLLKNHLNPFYTEIVHIGSTAVKDLVSKPIIDIMIGLNTLSNAKDCISIMESLDYQYIPEHEEKLPNRRFLRKPPRKAGYRLFHVHMVEIDSYFWKRQLLFRDYIREHKKARMEYEKLKLQLVKDNPNNRGAYVEGKTDFILKILELAQKKYNIQL